MQTLALRLHGKNDLRLDTFDLPALTDSEILADITTNSICMSCHKLAIQGQEHKRVPHNLSQKPIIIGHEFCGTILEVGKKHQAKFKPGMKYSIQPALNYPGRVLEAPGYSFQYLGGNATKVIIPSEVLEQDCLLPYAGEAFYKASLSEPVSCIVGAFNTQYHWAAGSYQHINGIVEGGATIILAGAGPMGLGAIDYAVNNARKRPKLLVITDVDQTRLDRAAEIFPVAEAARQGVDLRYVNTKSGNAVEDLLAITGGKGYDDLFVFAPVAPLIEQASKIAGFNGCINFFAGPSKKEFNASVNFYDVHYSGHHIVGSSGGNTDDMREALDLMARNKINPSVMITHVGGIDAAAHAILNLPEIPGGKKLIYTNYSMPLTALDDFEKLGATNAFFCDLADITKRNHGLWSVEAEKYMLKHGRRIE
jgi:threonine dehydrogenase-like Zn-dependent dehydrogenase